MKKTDMNMFSSDSPAVPKKQTPAGKANGGQASEVSHKALVEQFDLHHSPGHLLRRCHSRARAIFDDLVGRETGLSKQQVALMVTISHNPAATHALLSEETGFDRNTLADTIDRLISKGLAARERSTRDARAYEIRLTDEGQRQLEDLIPLSLEVQKKILAPLPEASRQHFIECLQMLAGVSESDFESESESESSSTATSANAAKRSAGRLIAASARTEARTVSEIKPALTMRRSRKKA